MIASKDTDVLRLRVARTFLQRLRGLIAGPPFARDEALLIVPCASIHTYWMRGAIDVVFLDAQAQVIRIVEALPPWRVAACRGSRAVLELPPGAARRLGWRAGSVDANVSMHLHRSV